MANPFLTSIGHLDEGLQHIDADSRISAARRFNLQQCRDALLVPNLQKTVRTFIERRIRKLEKEARK